MNRRFVLLAIAGALVVPAVYSVTRSDPEAKAKADGLQTLVSDPYRLDKIYRSMEGPWSIQSGIHLATGKKSGVQWSNLQAAAVRHAPFATSTDAPQPISTRLVSCASVSPKATCGLTRTNSTRKRAALARIRYQATTVPSGVASRLRRERTQKMVRYAAAS